MIIKYPELYKLDTKGKLRIWYMEQDEDKYRTIDGLFGGKLKISSWTTAKITNAGRSNERNPFEQATSEIQSEYTYRLDRDYYENVADVSNGSRVFEPMLANKYKTFKPGYVQPKLDGVRCIGTCEKMQSREGGDIVSVEFIRKEIERLTKKYPKIKLDGELYNHEFRDDFNKIISLVRKEKLEAVHVERIEMMVQYHVYDLPSHTGKFSERHDELIRMSKDFPDFIKLVDTVYVPFQEHYDEYHGKWLEEGYEGSIWRDDTPYEQKRTNSLLKRKEFMDAEFECLKIVEGEGNWSGVAKALWYKVPGAKINPGDHFVEPGSDTILKYVNGVKPSNAAVRAAKSGIKGSRKRAKELLHEKHKIVTIQYFQLTPDGVPRFPVAIKFWGDRRDL